MKEYFKQLQEENQTMVHRQEEKTARLSACRLISFLVAFVMLVIGIVDHKMAVTIAGVIVLASFWQSKRTGFETVSDAFSGWVAYVFGDWGRISKARAASWL